MNSPSLAVTHFESTHRKTNPGIVTQPCCQPDWQGIRSALGEVTNDPGEDRAEARERLCKVVRGIMDFICGPADARQGDWEKLCGRRAVALKHALDNDAFGQSASVHQLSRELGFERRNFHRLAGQAAKAFGLKPATNEKAASLLKADGENSPASMPGWSASLNHIGNSINKGVS